MMKISSLFFVGSMLFTANNVMAADWDPVHRLQVFMITQSILILILWMPAKIKRVLN